MTTVETITRRKTKSFWFFLALAVLVGSVVVYRVIPLSYKGKVKDAETGRALSGVNVLLEVSTALNWPLGYLSPGFWQYGSGESTTDSNGMYSVRLEGLRPSPWNLISTHFTYFKLGYFPGYYGSHSTDVGLYRMSHYLNFCALLSKKGQAAAALWSGRFEDRYKQFKESLELIYPPESTGVFYKSPGANFMRIYGQVTESGGYLDKMTYCLLDQNAKIWLVLDSRGKIVDRKDCSKVSWESMSSQNAGAMSGYGHLYASKNAIFSTGYPDRSIVARKGNVSAVAGVPDDFITIEDNGRFLCHYASRWAAKARYPEVTPAPGESHGFLRAFRVPDLVGPHEKGVSEGSRFTHISYCDGRYFVVAKTPNYWHVCKLFDRSGQRPGKLTKKSFPAKREITAMAVGADSIYIAFVDEGIRRFGLFNNEEAREFFDRSNQYIRSNVRCLAYGSAVNIPAIYAVTGTDIVYRFSDKGVPDYPVTAAKEKSPEDVAPLYGRGVQGTTVIVRRGAQIRRVVPTTPGKEARSGVTAVFPRRNFSNTVARQDSQKQSDEDLVPLIRNGHPVQVMTPGQPPTYRQLKMKRGRLNSLLIKLSEKGDLGFVKMYLESGANVNTRDKLGNTPLIKASVKGHSNVVTLLLQYGADVNAKNNNGSTALIGAAEAGHYELVRLLTRSGADTSAKDNRGRSALWWAQRKDYHDIEEHLQESGAK